MTLRELDKRARDAVVGQLHLDEVPPNEKRICVVEGPAGAGKSTLVRRVLELNPRCNILYLTLTGTLAKRSADESYADETRVTCATLDAITYCALCVMLKGNVCMSEMTPNQGKMDREYQAIEAWAKMSFGGDMPEKAQSIVDRIMQGDEEAQRKYLTWPLLRRLVLD